MTYTKCSEYSSDKPTPRSLNLVSAIKVQKILKISLAAKEQLFEKYIHISIKMKFEFIGLVCALGLGKDDATIKRFKLHGLPTSC